MSMAPYPLGFVEIHRKRGRIAGFGKCPVPIDVLWCGTNRPRKKFGQRKNGWSFPPAVRELLLQECQGSTVLHPFGGNTDFGVRMDIDVNTRPDVVADAYFPPFPRDSFDNVVLDPPYTNVRQQEKMALLWAAAWVARKHVYWFHTTWLTMDLSLPLVHAWLIRVGDMCSVRCLQKFEVREPKHRPFTMGEFKRGEALKYNRWQLHHPGLPFTDVLPARNTGGKEAACGGAKPNGAPSDPRAALGGLS